MSSALIRFARRRANWEDPKLPLEELQSREFKARDGGPDLRPSVYELDDVDTQLIQAYAEHAHRIDPPPSALALDVASAAPGEVEASPGDAPFRFTRGRHREVVLGDLCELLRFVRAARSVPRRDVEKKAVQSYVGTCLESADEEWTALSTSPQAKTWLKKLAQKHE